MPSTIQEMCRICLHPKLESEDTTPITEDGMATKIRTVFNFELPADDPLPCRMCRICSSKIDDFYEFHERVRSNQDQLRTMAIPVDEEDIKQEQGESDCEESAFDPEIKREADSDSDSEDEVLAKVRKVEKSRKVDEESRKIREFFKLGCESCSKCFESFDQLQRHTRKAHNERASIKCCNRVFYKKCRILEHINKHIDPNLFHCEICSKSYNSKYYLDLHNLKMHSVEGGSPFNCEKCGRGFPKEYLLKAHLETHVQAVCTVCNRTMASSATLRIHMINVHGEGTKHICDTCGQEFRTKLAMNRHIKQHLGINPIERVQCHICSKWVNGKYNLKLHIRTVHSDNQSVPCNVCHQIYPNERALSSHRRRVHVEEKFECEFCGKKFKRSIYLKEHRASHTGQALYSCDVCGMTTNSNANLYSHKKSKHPEQWLEAKKKAQTAAYG